MGLVNGITESKANRVLVLGGKPPSVGQGFPPSRSAALTSPPPLDLFTRSPINAPARTTRQVHNQLGETPPDVEDFKPLVAAFKATQALLDT